MFFNVVHRLAVHGGRVHKNAIQCNAVHNKWATYCSRMYIYSQILSPITDHTLHIAYRTPSGTSKISVRAVCMYTLPCCDEKSKMWKQVSNTVPPHALILVGWCRPAVVVQLRNDKARVGPHDLAQEERGRVSACGSGHARVSSWLCGLLLHISLSLFEI